MINYTVFCPYAPDQQETLTDAWRATEICLDLAEEFGYAEVRDHFGNMYCDYGNVCQAVEDGVIWFSTTRSYWESGRLTGSNL